MLHRIHDLFFDPDKIQMVTVGRDVDGEFESLIIYLDSGPVPLSGGKAKNLYSLLLNSELVNVRVHAHDKDKDQRFLDSLLPLDERRETLEARARQEAQQAIGAALKKDY